MGLNRNNYSRFDRRRGENTYGNSSAFGSRNKSSGFGSGSSSSGFGSGSSSSGFGSGSSSSGFGSRNKSSGFGSRNKSSGFGSGSSSSGFGSGSSSSGFGGYDRSERSNNGGFYNQNQNNNISRGTNTFGQSGYTRRSRFSVPKGLMKILSWAVILFVVGSLLGRVNFGKLFSGNRPMKPVAEEPTIIEAVEPSAAVAAESNNRYFRRQLSGEYLTAYDSILYGLQNYQDTIEFELSNRDKLGDIYNSVFWDYPELFWANDGYAYSYSTQSGDPSMSVSPKSEFSAEQARQRVALVEERVTNVAAMFTGLSDYEKVKGVYEYIVNNTIYDYNYTDKTVYELFADGRAVCGSYARAAQYILQRLGVEAVYTEGYAVDDSGGSGRHAWLKVLIDGDYYNVDVTWGDPANEDGSQSLTHNYLCVTDDDISRSHFADPNPYPSCTATRCNYFVMENRMLSTYDMQLLIIWFNEDIAAGKRPEFRTINDDVYRQTISKLFDENEYYDIAPQVQGLSTNSCTYSADEKMRVITIL